MQWSAMILELLGWVDPKPDSLLSFLDPEPISLEYGRRWLFSSSNEPLIELSLFYGWIWIFRKAGPVIFKKL